MNASATTSTNQESMTPEVKLLVVDDEATIRSVLTRLLKRLPQPPPVRVETAESAEAALQKMERESFDLVFTDFNMGGKDGIYLLARVRERWPETRRLLMTGYTDEHIRRKALSDGGAQGFVRKPWDSQELLALITDALAARAR
jgi:CheY-like chemotaxis protein